MGDKHNQLNRIFSDKLSDKKMTIRDYLGDSLGVNYYYRHPRNYNRRGIFSVDEPSPTVRGVNRPVPKGYKVNTCDPEGVNLEGIRPLTTIERSYLQTFPESFKFTGTKTDLEQMIGNAVPVNLGRFIAEGIIEYLKNGSREEPTLFDFIDIDSKQDNPFEMPNKALQRTLASSRR